MSEAPLRGWILANALGLCLAFLSFVPGQAISLQFAPDAVVEMETRGVPQHIDPDALPEWLDRQTYEVIYRFNLLGHVIALALFGAIWGSLQAFVLRQYLARTWPWILATTAGVPTVLLFELLRRHLVIGPHRGPVEPIMIALGGGAIAGVFQWLYLRKQGSAAPRWLGSWIVGLAVGIALSIPVIMAFEIMLLPTLLGLLSSEAVANVVDWAGFLIIYGGITGAVAGWISRGALLESLHALPNDRARPPARDIAGHPTRG